MTDALLFIHVLSAAALVTGLVAFTAIAYGASVELSALRLYTALWHIGLVGVFLLGIALAIDIDGYEIWDAWVLIAIGLWLVVGGFGDRLPAAYKEAGGPGSTLPAGVFRSHWITVVIVLLMLADMIVKPWA
ncbi:MAG: hypothetical protein U0R51_03945 [Solirubrobacterales bacterium]